MEICNKNIFPSSLLSSWSASVCVCVDVDVPIDIGLNEWRKGYVFHAHPLPLPSSGPQKERKKKRFFHSSSKCWNICSRYHFDPFFWMFRSFNDDSLSGTLNKFIEILFETTEKGLLCVRICEYMRICVCSVECKPAPHKNTNNLEQKINRMKMKVNNFVGEFYSLFFSLSFVNWASVYCELGFRFEMDGWNIIFLWLCFFYMFFSLGISGRYKIYSIITLCKRSHRDCAVVFRQYCILLFAPSWLVISSVLLCHCKWNRHTWYIASFGNMNIAPMGKRYWTLWTPDRSVGRHFAIANVLLLCSITQLPAKSNLKLSDKFIKWKNFSPQDNWLLCLIQLEKRLFFKIVIKGIRHRLPMCLPFSSSNI